jgi:2-isopropylmalate synthase
LLALESFRVVVEKQGGGPASTEAVVKLRVRGERVVTIGEGNGPVHALDHALRKALEDHYSELANVELSNYTVRILDPGSGTGAVTRVIIESRGGADSWSTVGVSANLIEASWEALVEGLLYGARVRVPTS